MTRVFPTAGDQYIWHASNQIAVNKSLGFTSRVRAARFAPVRMSLLFLSLISALWCHASDIVMVRLTATPSTEQNELAAAADFYGLNLKFVTMNAKASDLPLRQVVGQSNAIAVVIEARALTVVNQQALFQALQRKSGPSVPLLILGTTPDTDVNQLKTWSGGAVIGGKELQSPSKLQYVFGHVAEITQQLSDVAIPVAGKRAFYLSLNKTNRAQQLLGLKEDNGEVAPLFVETDLHQQSVFLAAKMFPSSNDNVVDAFAEIAPVMMFVKHCAGERGWHALHHYANLTIDDPWLREPYGLLSYSGLLSEMERHNFHTTIAFIPWNYDRSQPQVVSLFRSHPDKFSICIHGNDHDHKEFTDLRSKPLPLQVAALRQSLARMENFRRLTGITYDKVFVFPHSIGLEEILEQLRADHFLATVNARNVPMDRPKPNSPSFALRPATLAYANFPSILRYSMNMPMPAGFLEINQFLDNPLFFYGHQDSFASGPDAFDATADAVNRLDPEMRWRSAGEIVRHLYLVRKRDDADYDVLSFSSDLQLENPSDRNLTFRVTRQENKGQLIAAVNVDGSRYPFSLHDGYLDVSVPIPAGQMRSVQVEYEGDINLAAVDTSKHSFRVYCLRMASDFRDIVLSQWSLGRRLTVLYYKYELSPAQAVLCVLVVIVFSVGALRWFVVIIRRKTPVRVNSVATTHHS